MASGNAVRHVYTPGRIVVGPSGSLATGTYPYGGTEVGHANECLAVFEGEPFVILSEGLGEPTDILEPSNTAHWGCFLRGFDDDAVQQFLGGMYAAGSVTQHATFDKPGTVTPGKSALSRAKVILYVADDIEHADSVLIYSGVPMLVPDAEIPFQRREESGIPLRVYCFRDSNGNMIRFGRLADLSLT